MSHLNFQICLLIHHRRFQTIFWNCSFCHIQFTKSFIQNNSLYLFLNIKRKKENFPLKSCVCTIENYETYMKLLELMFLSSTKSRMKQGIVEEFLLVQWKLLSENFTLRNDLLMVVFHLLVTYIVGQNILVL